MRSHEFTNIISESKISGDQQRNFISMVERFLPLAMSILDISSLPKIKFESGSISGSQPSFGKYIDGDRILHISIINRHPVDILRTLAHELVHYRQDVRGELNDHSGVTGSPEENQAHEIAGVILRVFNKKYPEFLKSRPL